MILYCVIGILVNWVSICQKAVRFILYYEINANIINYITTIVYNLQDDSFSHKHVINKFEV